MASCIALSSMAFFCLLPKGSRPPRKDCFRTRPSTIRSEGGIVRLMHKVSRYLVQIARSFEKTCRSRKPYWLDCCPCRCKHRHQPLPASHSSIIPKKLTANPNCLPKSNRWRATAGTVKGIQICHRQLLWENNSSLISPSKWTNSGSECAGSGEIST